MTRVLSLAVGAAAVLATASASAAPAVEDGVVVLTPSNFDEVVGKDVPVFVEFYAPWCGHCKNLAPEWATTAQTFSKADGVIVAKVDADAHRELGEKFGVQGFPTIKWFPAGEAAKPEDYTGGRTADDLVAFINGKVGTSKRVKKAPTSVVDLTPENFDAVINAPGVAKFVEFYAPWCGHCKALAPTWEKLAAVFAGDREVVIAKVDADKHRSLGTRFGVSGFPTLKWFPAQADAAKTAEDVATDYNGGRDLADLVAHVNEGAGTHRAPNGGLLSSAGRLPEFDEIAAKFVAAANKAALVAEATELAAGLKADAAAAKKADAYLKAFAKVAEKGAAWLAKETARLDGMIASEAVAPGKKTEMALKRNVLLAFSPASAEATVEPVPAE